MCALTPRSRSADWNASTSSVEGRAYGSPRTSL